jgi:hypothetical protein
MPVYQIATEADDGTVWRNWATSSSTGSTGAPINLSVTCYADGNFRFFWTPVAQQASFRVWVRNNIGLLVYESGCGALAPDTDNNISLNEPLYERTDGPFTLELYIYRGNIGLCNGDVVAAATASGFDYPDSTTLDNTSKLFIGDTADTGSHPFNGNAWMRFTNINIPQGANILSGTLTLQASLNQGVTSFPLDVKIVAEDSSNPTNPTSYNNYWARTRTSNALTESISVWDPSVNYTYTITSIIQEIVDRPDWVSGNSILMFLEDMDSAYYGSVATGIYILVQDYPSLYAPQLTIEHGIAASGTAAGTSTANAATLWGAKGNAEGQSVADGFGTFTITVVATAAGSSSVEGVGRSNIEAVGTAAGTSDLDDADGRNGKAAVGTAAGTSNADDAPTKIEWVAIGTSSGLSTTAATGISTNQSVGSIAGISAVNGIGSSQAAVIGVSTGVGTASGVAESQAESAGTSVGVADADDAVGLMGWDSIGSSAGINVTSGVGSSEARTIGVSDGLSIVVAEREVLFSSEGTSSGTVIVHAGGSRGLFIVGSATGLAKSVGRILPYQRIWLQDLSERLGVRSASSDSFRFLELNGASIIEPTAFEPDPATYRLSHYYNAVTNTLYRKVVTRNEPGIVVAYWQKVSD